jgi:AcrR family transcriptional regulator
LTLPKSQKKFTRDKESKIDSIVQATIHLIEERGYERFSVNDIPKKAGLSIGTIYRYFPQGKPDVLREIIKRNTKKMMDLSILEQIIDSNFNRIWSKVVTEYVRGHREKRFTLSEIGLEYGREVYTKDMRPLILEFYQNFTDSFRKLKMFNGITDYELLVKIAMVFGIMGLLTKSQMKQLFFASDDRLIEYLIAISHSVFKLK